MFGCLAPLLLLPLPNPLLQNHLKACSNLTAFCHKILKTYLQEEYIQGEHDVLRTDALMHNVLRMRFVTFGHNVRSCVLLYGYVIIRSPDAHRGL